MNHLNHSFLSSYASSKEIKKNPVIMPETINGTINHEQINRLVREYKGQLAAPVKANLRRLRTQIDAALDGENNVKVYIYISDELDEPICLQTGAGDNELVIDIEEYGIDYTWTKKTFWKRAKEFFKNAASKIVQGLISIWGSVFSILSIASSAMKAIPYI